MREAQVTPNNVDEKKKLDWEEAAVFWSGAVELSVTSARTDHGEIYSMMFGRMNKQGERVSGFLRAEDTPAIRDLCDQVDAWFKHTLTTDKSRSAP